MFDMADQQITYIDSLNSKLRLLTCEINTLTRLRDRMTGHLRMSAQRHLNEALALRETLNKELRAYRGEA